jgi:hypothetical protein
LFGFNKPPPELPRQNFTRCRLVIAFAPAYVTQVQMPVSTNGQKLT